MTDIRLLAHYDESGFSRLDIVGDRQERLIDAVRRAQGLPVSLDDYPLFIREWRGEEQERARSESQFPNYVEVPPSTTMAQVATFVDGEEFVLTHGGWGGDALWFEPLVTIWEASGLEITMVGLWAAARKADNRLTSIRYRRHRGLAADWRDSDEQEHVPLELAQMVKSRREWYRDHFDSIFALDDASGTSLLKALGYRKVQRDPHALWQEVEESVGKRHGYDFDVDAGK